MSKDEQKDKPLQDLGYLKKLLTLFAIPPILYGIGILYSILIGQLALDALSRDSTTGYGYLVAVMFTGVFVAATLIVIYLYIRLLQLLYSHRSLDNEKKKKEG
jgi:hypothetical protein